MPHRAPHLLAATALTLWSSASAQPTTAPPPAPTAASALPVEPFLEQRVLEELAADGVLLSRLGVTLAIEDLGPVVLVSLIDPRTQRTMASTKVATLPADRDGAVATLTPVVAGLAAQLIGHVPGPDVDHDRLARIEANQREHAARLEAERQAQAAREAAEQAYLAEALRFDREPVLDGTSDAPVLRHQWVAYRGPDHERLEPTAFYRQLGRPDLAAAYRRRQTIKWVAAAGGAVATVAAIAVMLKDETVAVDTRNCRDQDPSCDLEAKNRAWNQEQDARDRNLTIGMGIALAGVVAFGVGAYYQRRPHPISEREARKLGADYNRRVRERLGLPVPHRAASPAASTTVRVAPYAGQGGGGFVLAGTF